MSLGVQDLPRKVSKAPKMSAHEYVYNHLSLENAEQLELLSYPMQTGTASEQTKNTPSLSISHMIMMRVFCWEMGNMSSDLKKLEKSPARQVSF